MSTSPNASTTAQAHAETDRTLADAGAELNRLARAKGYGWKAATLDGVETQFHRARRGHIGFRSLSHAAQAAGFRVRIVFEPRT